MRTLRLSAVRIVAAALTAAIAGCSGFSFFVANAPAHFGAFKRTANVVYGPDARQRLDVYSPRDAERCPVVVFFYGGSWSAGEKSEYAFVGAALAKRGYVTAIPDYRLYPQVRFPDFIDDGASAVAWVQQHAREFGGDPDRMVLMGHSAGAHIAAMLALDQAYLGKAGVSARSIVGLVAMSGPYALDPNTDTLRTIFSSPYTPQDWQPVQFAGSRSPPTLLLHGLADTVVDYRHAEKLRDALISHGAQVEAHFYAKRGHADTIGSFALALRFRTPALEQTLDFLHRVTAPSAKSDGD